MRRAVANESLNASRTFVICAGQNDVVAYYSLAAGALDREDAPGSLRRNMPDPIPVIVLGRLAVDVRHQREGLGWALLRDAMRRTFGVATEVAVKALLVHAISADAHCFYSRYGFIESPRDAMTLLLPVTTMTDASNAAIFK